MPNTQRTQTVADLNFEELRDQLVPETMSSYTAGLACVFAQDTDTAFGLNTHDMETLALIVGIEADNRRKAATGDFYACAFVEAAARHFNESDDPPKIDDLFAAGQAESDAIAS